MAYFMGVVAIVLCGLGVIRIVIGTRVLRDELAKRNPTAAARYFGLAFVGGWGVLMIGVQILMFIVWANSRLNVPPILWPGVTGVLSLVIAMVWGSLLKRPSRRPES